MPSDLDRDRLESILDAATDRLEGEWLLLGGALVALWLRPRRVTEDLDLVGLAGGNEARLALMGLAVEQGLPVEAVNSAADFFLRRIHGWREELEPFRRGPRAVIYRPSPTLFLLLKIGRLSERDLDDCEAMIDEAVKAALPLDRERVLTALDALPPSQDAETLRRRAALRALLADT